MAVQTTAINNAVNSRLAGAHTFVYFPFCDVCRDFIRPEYT